VANLDETSRRIRAEAARLGFDLCGVTSADPPPHTAAYLEWLEAGRHGEMAYLAEARNLARRLDPRLVLPGCQSILTLAMRYSPSTGLPAPANHPLPYTTGKTTATAPAGQALIAAYAYGSVYHEVLIERLNQLGAFVAAQFEQPVNWKAYTDTGPLLERDLAQRAGLGWIGKNSMLINPRLGSFFFLGEILLDVALPPDAPFTTDRCGACTRCIQACPTGCILPNRTLDAQRCISYLTIENKADIPADLRPQIGAWAFGCDVCQQVCPWNLRFAAPAAEPAFAPVQAAPHPNPAPDRGVTTPAELCPPNPPQDRGVTPHPYLAQDLRLDAQAFNRKFKGRPQKRARRRGYLRNLAVAAGNTGDHSIVPVLEAAAQDQ
jgi:epoxyqueuosine reductase